MVKVDGGKVELGGFAERLTKLLNFGLIARMPRQDWIEGVTGLSF
jgi:hypothetical protein